MRKKKYVDIKDRSTILFIHGLPTSLLLYFATKLQKNNFLHNVTQQRTLGKGIRKSKEYGKLNGNEDQLQPKH